MQNTAGPIPPALAARRIEHDLAGRRRDIDLGSGGIAESSAKQGPMAIEAVRHAPLIVVRTSDDCGPCGIEPALTGMILRDGERDIGRRRRRVSSVGGANRS